MNHCSCDREISVIYMKPNCIPPTAFVSVSNFAADMHIIIFISCVADEPFLLQLTLSFLIC